MRWHYIDELDASDCRDQWWLERALDPRYVMRDEEEDENYPTAVVRKAYELTMQMDGGHLVDLFQEIDTEELARLLFTNLGSWLSHDIYHVMLTTIHKWYRSLRGVMEPEIVWLKAPSMLWYEMETFVDWYGLACHFQMSDLSEEEEDGRRASCGRFSALRCSRLADIPVDEEESERSDLRLVA